MSKPVTMWAVVNPKGKLDKDSVRSTLRESIHTISYIADWKRYWESKGYRAVKVRVEVAE